MELVIPLLAAGGLALFFSGLPPVRRIRLRDRVDPFLSGLQGKPSGLLVRSAIGRPSVRYLEMIATRWLPKGDAHLAARLKAAGLSILVSAFRTEQLIWGAAGAVGIVVCWGLARSAGMSLDPKVVPLLIALAGAIGYLGRDWWLGRQVEARMSLLKEELPIAMDLMTLSVMAGESVGAACGRVGQVLGSGIGEEFRQIVASVRAGTPIVESLEDFARRVPEPGVGRFVDALMLGIEKGAPLAETLRAQADDVREARRRYLLELGGRREVAMLIPVVFLILPTVILFALYPGLVSLELLVP